MQPCPTVVNVIVKFDDLSDEYSNTGEELRGYLLDEVEVDVDEKIDNLSTSKVLSGSLIYNCNPQEHFSALTANSENLSTEAVLLGSEEFAQRESLTEGDTICYTIEGVRFERVFKMDTSMKGAMALNPTFDMGLSTALLSSYRFNQVDLEKVGS